MERHADQFEQDVPVRPPGSQEEFAAATYITGHLQQAGYVVRLDSVPVANTVRSSNVVALPPSGQPPRIVVAVSYGTDPTERDADAGDIGAFLEVARVLRARSVAHNVEFVALGAKSENLLGSRRLAQVLLDEGVEPRIVYLSAGDDPDPRETRPFKDAGFDLAVISGTSETIAHGLLSAIEA